jgi:hypothetical protein
MSQIAELQINVSGDIGGIGVSRLRFVRQDAASITGVDCNAAAAAAMAMVNSMKTYIPTFVTWALNPEVHLYDIASGLVAPPLSVTTVPGSVTGVGGSTAIAGIGARLNWHTSTMVGRRILRGAFFWVPLASGMASSTGAVSGSVQTAVNGSSATYVNAMTTAMLYPVVWHRPAKGASTGGMMGIITSGSCSAVPAGLRSRRS